MAARTIETWVSRRLRRVIFPAFVRSWSAERRSFQTSTLSATNAAQRASSQAAAKRKTIVSAPTMGSAGKLPTAHASPERFQTILTGRHQKVKILVLGGTKFLGRATVEAALERGHDVTLFNRGETNPELFPEVEKIRGDRTEDLSPLESRAWEAAIDPSGYFPHVVWKSAEALEGSVGRYLFVSSTSVYSDLSKGPSEDSPRAELGDMPADEMLPEYDNYGALKALSEDAVWEVYGDRATIVRPGLIVGPHDPTGRFTYWPHRAARGGEMVVPAPPERTVQFVDVRDLGRWLVELLERDEGGAFNATRSAVSWQELIDSARSVAGSDATPVWIPDEFLSEHEVGVWMELPMWLADPEWVGMNQAEVSRAEAAGLSHRPLEDTIRGTLDAAETTDDAGMKPEREGSCWRHGGPPDRNRAGGTRVRFDRGCPVDRARRGHRGSARRPGLRPSRHRRADRCRSRPASGCDRRGRGRAGLDRDPAWIRAPGSWLQHSGGRRARPARGRARRLRSRGREPVPRGQQRSRARPGSGACYPRLSDAQPGRGRRGTARLRPARRRRTGREGRVR